MTDDRPPRTPEQIARWLVQYRHHPTPKLPTHAECLALARAYLAEISSDDDAARTLATEGQIYVTREAALQYQRAAAPRSPIGDEEARRQLHRWLIDARQDGTDLALWRYRSRSSGDGVDVSARVDVDQADPRIVVVTAAEVRSFRRAP